jgi:parallel beta-helix repeat protein
MSIWDSSEPMLQSCAFLNNTCGNEGGGAIHVWNNSKPVLQSCTFGNNTATAATVAAFSLAWGHNQHSPDVPSNRTKRNAAEP